MTSFERRSHATRFKTWWKTTAQRHPYIGFDVEFLKKLKYMALEAWFAALNEKDPK